MLQRFLDPDTLASISGLDLVAKTVVDGFVSGLHRSPDFGFSQEFAEYRAYSPGDDLRHVDWNVFARTERCYLKRYRGETNSQLLVLLDTSASMGYGSQPVTKLDSPGSWRRRCATWPTCSATRPGSSFSTTTCSTTWLPPPGRGSSSAFCTPSRRPRRASARISPSPSSIS